MRDKVEFEVKIHSSNEAFDERPELEVARILRDIADSIQGSTTYCEGNAVDINGNRVGSFLFEVEEDDEETET